MPSFIAHSEGTVHADRVEQVFSIGGATNGDAGLFDIKLELGYASFAGLH